MCSLKDSCRHGQATDTLWRRDTSGVRLRRDRVKDALDVLQQGQAGLQLGLK